MTASARTLTANDLFGGMLDLCTGPRWFNQLIAIIFLLPLTVIAVRAQTSASNVDAAPQVFDGVINNNVYGLGRSIRINGTIKEGAMALGGDVIVQGSVEGDVAAIGGSVIQLPGARIGGDVIVVGGSYRPSDKVPLRDPARMTMMYAGYEQELKSMMRNPAGIMSPSWTPAYIGLRVLSILFWFVAALGLTTAMPGVVSRGVSRIRLTSLRVAIIGFVATMALTIAVFGGFLLPTALSVLVGLIAGVFLLVSWIFGRVVICAAVGRWLQGHFVSRLGQSESVALLLGTALWAVLSSLPYVWPFAVAFSLVLSFGLTLTAGSGKGWKRPSVL